MNAHLKQEKPAPTRLALNTTKVQETEGQESSKDICNIHGSPEKAQSYR
jgi:hypothetical protein